MFDFSFWEWIKYIKFHFYIPFVLEYDAGYEQEDSDTEAQSIYEKPKSRQRDSLSKDLNFFKASADNINSKVTHRFVSYLYDRLIITKNKMLIENKIRFKGE